MAPVTRPIHTAEIIAVGSELLTPHKIDTNSLYLTAVLNELGVSVHVKTVVGDSASDLAEVVTSSLSRADLVLTTGGLGPTDDDITRDVLARVLGRTLLPDAEVMRAIEARFARRNLRMPEVNRRQALVIEGATWLPNPNGTAPGQILDAGGRLVVLLPGPPRELQPMFRESVAPVVGARAAGRRLRRRLLKVTGRSESQVEEIAQPIYSKLGRVDLPVETTILASPGQIELHLSAGGTDEAAIDALLDDGVRQLVEALGDAVFSVNGRSLEEVVGGLLLDQGWRIGAAESCTGGMLLARLTDVPGSSAWVHGGVVAYSNDVKTSALGVEAPLLEAHGAVSEPVAQAMAEGVRRQLGTDVGVAITGIAGPGGGSDEKPVGTVVIAVASDHTDVRRFLFPGDRTMIRTFSTAAALDMIRRHLDG
jgi:nicotinamide-nucleotide amidase